MTMIGPAEEGGGATETHPGTNGGKTGAIGGRTIGVTWLGAVSAEVMKTGAAGTLRTGVPGTLDTLSGLGAVAVTATMG